MALTKGKKGYTIPMDLEALTIGQAQDIYKALAEDEDYRQFLSGAEEEHWSHELLVYARKATRIMAMLAGVDMSAVEFLRDDEVVNIAPQFEFGVLRPLYHFGVYQPKEFEKFEFEGVEYRMPLSINDGFGGVMPMAEVTAEEWAESNDLRIASSNPIEYAHLIVAILCRPEGEKYNERVARERAEQFKQLPCSLAFDVFFLQVCSYEYYSRSYRATFAPPKSGGRGKGGESSFGQWKQRLFFAASDSNGGVLPCELARVKQWSVGEFLELLEYKLEEAENRAK